MANKKDENLMIHLCNIFSKFKMPFEVYTVAVYNRLFFTYIYLAYDIYLANSLFYLLTVNKIPTPSYLSTQTLGK